MKALQIILITAIALSGCTKKAEVMAKTADTTTVKTTPDDSGVFSYLALGDSYTIGQSVLADESFPVQLTSLMNVSGLYTQVPTIIATTGWTTTNLIDAISENAISRNGNQYDFVTLLIGVNDQYQGLSQDSYRTNFELLLHTAIKFAKGDSTRVFVLSIPDYGVTPFAMGRDDEIGPEIDQFNAINKQESLNAGVNYCDITAISREAATDTSLIALDGLHPSPKMYKLWIQQLEPMVAARLNKK